MNDELRREIDLAVGEVVRNVTNFPEKVQPHLLGQDMGPLREAIVAKIEERIDGAAHLAAVTAPLSIEERAAAERAAHPVVVASVEVEFHDVSPEVVSLITGGILPADEMGRFGFDGAEGIAFWIYADASHEEAQARIMFDDLPTLAAFLRHNLPGMFASTPLISLIEQIEELLRQAERYAGSVLGIKRFALVDSTRHNDAEAAEYALNAISRVVTETRARIPLTDEDRIEAAARSIAGLEPGEPWPSNEVRRRDNIRDTARAALKAAGVIA